MKLDIAWGKKFFFEQIKLEIAWGKKLSFARFILPEHSIMYMLKE